MARRLPSDKSRVGLAPGGKIGGQGDPFDLTVAQHQPGAGDQAGQRGLLPCPNPQAGQFLQRRESPHHTRDRIAVGDGDGRRPSSAARVTSSSGCDAPAQEAEVRGHAKFGIGGHGNTPCANHAENPGAVCGVQNGRSRGPTGQFSMRQ